MWRQRLEARRRSSKGLTRSKLLATFARFSFLGVIGLFLLALVVIPILAFTLPAPDSVVRQDGFSTKILDRNGDVLYDIFEDQRRTPVTLDQIPMHLRYATIAIEDKNFYKHQGFDPFGMVRGVSRIVTLGRAQGGSTLTQQLVKNALLSSERSLLRKIKEFVLAVQIEKKYSKDQILELYLNEIPYGGTAYGVEAASEVYFGKRVNDLSLVEAAILAGIPQRPSAYSPYSSTPKAYVGRAEQVLRRMREDGYISEEDEESAKSQLDGIEFQKREASFKAPHFVQYVQKILEERYGESVLESGGLRVTTTLDLELHDKIQGAVTEEIEKVEAQKITNGGVVVIDPETGEILSMVGSKNFNDPDYDGQVNVTTALRQPGSAIKPITYVTAFKEGYGPSSLLMDVPTTFPGGIGQPDYTPVNYDGKFRGPVQIRYALGNSINVTAVKMLALVGIRDVLQTATDLGITTLPPTQETLNRVGLSLTLGGGEVKLLDLTAAYSPFMNGGFRAEPVAILKVEDSNGKVLEEVEPKKGKRVLSEGEAFLMANVLSDNSARAEVFGTNSLLNISGRQIAVKTGTTNDKRDNWTVGGNSQVVVGVWVGNNDNSPMLNVASGVSGASPIWRRSILAALNGKPIVSFKQPEDVGSMEVDSVSGARAHDGFPSRVEFFIRGREPGEDKVHVKLKLCKNDGKLANPSDVASGNYEEKEFFVFKEEDPTGGILGQNKWQEGILNWLSTQSDPRYHPPTEYCGATNPVSVGFNEPGNESSNLNNQFEIKLRAESTSKIVRVELYIDDQNVRNYDGPPYTYSANLQDGVHKLKVVAKDEKNNQGENTITVGVKTNWNATPSPSPSPTATP